MVISSAFRNPVNESCCGGWYWGMPLRLYQRTISIMANETQFMNLANWLT